MDGPGELLWVAPEQTVLDENIRSNPDLTPEFVESVRLHGVRDPLLGTVDDAGRVVIEDGQRRRAAAIQVGRELIPVFARRAASAAPDDAAAATVQRITNQWIANEQRAALSVGDRLAAAQTLFELGVQPDEAARQLGAPRAEMRRARKLLRTVPDAPERMREHPQVTLDQLAEIVAYDAYPEIRARLVKVAEEEPHRFEHQLELSKSAKIEADELAEAIAELEADGYVYLNWSTYRDSADEEYWGLDELIREESEEEGAEVEPEQAKAHGGLVVSLQRVYAGWDSERQEQRYRWERQYLVHQPFEHGYLDRYPDLDDAEDEDPEVAEQRAAEEAAQEAAEAERRSRAAEAEEKWKAATVVRQRWIAGLLSRPSMPESTLHWLALAQLGERPFKTEGWERHASAMLLCKWLGLDDAAGQENRLAVYVAEKPAARAWRVALGMVLATIEVHRFPRWVDASYPTAKADMFLRQLETWGYGLSEIEWTLIAAADERAALAAAQTEEA